MACIVTYGVCYGAGGQVEIMALCASLRRPIWIYCSDRVQPIIKMGEPYGDLNPLRISYHKHYYTLGEHYNSVV